MTGWFAMVAFYHCSPTVVSSSCFVYSPINYNLAKFPLTHRGELGLSPGGQIWVIIRGGAGAPGGRPRLSPSWLWEISLLVTLLLSCHDRLSRDTNNIQPSTNYQLPPTTWMILSNTPSLSLKQKENKYFKNWSRILSHSPSPRWTIMISWNFSVDATKNGASRQYPQLGFQRIMHFTDLTWLSTNS